MNSVTEVHRGSASTVGLIPQPSTRKDLVFTYFNNSVNTTTIHFSEPWIESLPAALNGHVIDPGYFRRVRMKCGKTLQLCRVSIGFAKSGQS